MKKFGVFVSIPLMGAIICIILFGVLGFFPKSDFGVEDMKQVIGVISSLNIALFALIPVSFRSVGEQIDRSSNKNIKKSKGRSQGLLKHSCFSLMFWCFISLIIASIWYFSKKECFFIVVFSLNLAIVIFWLIWFYVIMSPSWPKTFSDNLQKQDS